MNRLALILTISLACFSRNVLATDSGFYLGAGLAKDRLTTCTKITATSGCINTFTSNSQQTANLRLLGGYAFGKHLAIEGGLSGFGTYDVQDTFGNIVGNAKASAITIAAKGTITFPHGFSMFGKAGLARTRMQYSANPGWVLTMPARQTSNGLLLGAGGQYDFNDAMAVRLWTEVVTYNDDGYRGAVGGTDVAAIFKF